MFQIPNTSELSSESDVEQKLVYPFLVAENPFGLGFKSYEIQTKQNIRKITIGKNSSKKIYFPDYVIIINGYPVVIIEVKKPHEDVDEAFREARHYAAEINSLWPTGINPVSKIFATDGIRLLAGLSDQSEAVLRMPCSELSPSFENMIKLQNLIGRTSVEREISSLEMKEKPHRYWKPRQLIGGVSIQHEEIERNTFGATLSAEFTHIFNPIAWKDRLEVAKNGYISSRRRERYKDPIDRVIRASRPISETDATCIEDTSSPKEVIKILGAARPLEHQVLLIIGSVGAGKTTFVDHLQTVALPQDLVDTTVWVRINMNNSPSSSEEIYNWLRNEIVAGCRSAYPQIDFDSLDTIKKVFSVEINIFNKGTGKLYIGERYNEKLAECIENALLDQHKKTVAYTRYCSTERGKLLIIVMDNCDKRTRNQQLLMFEAAQWLQKEFRSLVILPLRDETYDNHKNEPPLDTALKDLVFRIEPPLFHNLLVRRVQMALNEIKNEGDKVRRYDLPNGFHVEYSDSDKAYYLTSIVKAFFEYDKHVRRLIIGLSGRNVRRALEMFLEFCTSGHISEDQIYRITHSEGEHVPPLHIVIRVLLRMNRRFYDSKHSYIKNVFSIDSKDARPNFFTRLVIMRWLLKKFSQHGGKGLKGYFSIGNIISELSIYGIEADTIRREIEALTQALCIVSEDFRTEQLTDNDLVRLGPAGFVQLDVINNVDYLSAISEDTWFEDEKTARDIAGRIKDFNEHYKVNTTIENSRALIDFLKLVRSKDLASVESIFDNKIYEELSDISSMENSLSVFTASRMEPLWIQAEAKYSPGTEVVGLIVNVVDYGIFVEIEPGLTGLVHKTKLPEKFFEMESCFLDSGIIVRVDEIDPLRKRIKLDFIKPCVEENI
ncbi:type I restriction endonuclease [Acetobacter senegalensis]|uniref:type I restriction endonuclease n=1 Tax=Acetobacter senegalensis TaxID=446692 RepID=UPI001EDA2CAF|nr:type I restriction endonuclease [Acetobacter senegalensis]MCG4255620.1 S1 RNA-binding domain-containing protein [Acetobacter senegalensis]MCG4265527.1 S1 RNA-binding domain-containing protein [Acetobacter senegalensis]